MTQEQIIEGNKSIDEFMDNWLTNRGFSETELNYNSDWNCLMEVVEKIEKDYWVTIVTRLTKTSCAVHKPHKGFEQISRGDSFSKIHAIWLMVVSFIKWYNSCQKEENLK